MTSRCVMFWLHIARLFVFPPKDDHHEYDPF